MYLVTGASGNVGSQIVAQMLAAGHAVRAYVRDPSKLAQWNGRVDVVAGEYDTPDAFSAALDGPVEGVFLMNVGSADTFRELIARVAAKRVRRVVFLSTHMVESAPDTLLGRLHREKEDIIRTAGLDGRFLRPTGFMSNAYLWLPSVRASGVVPNPMGDGRAAPIAPEDIAAVAVRALTDASLTERELVLTGGEIISVPEQVALLSQAIDRPLRCADITLEQATDNLTRAGLPQPIAASVVKAYEQVKAGRAAKATDTVERLLGRKPLRFEQWLQTHVEHFR
ncbi:NAD(P)H-binding protein [Trinickia soli]|uniref:NmrA family transcriptional regulator n=1 Tax=Trinickia soli TaxID=380675 RepID=A0A2N7VQY4_9BURK|nr:NAD(P)H-binding protein [Trinickia soli]KAA0084891.1 NmrA family transcriptional regulator [Paraburkholderia sp. T12-10]PMS19564.1 NmrA family transcriptional regulator [Trinickia soli]CAB3717410.1 NAD(P)H azoreductase [Trinickia soli]